MGTGILQAPHCFTSFLSKVRSRHQQHRHDLGACSKCRISGPVPDLLNQNLHSNQRPQGTRVCVQVLEALLWSLV